MRLLFDAICAVSLIYVMASLPGNQKPSQPPESSPVTSLKGETSRYALIPPIEPEPAQEVVKEQEQPTFIEESRPYERTAELVEEPAEPRPYQRPMEVVEPVCTPSRYEIVQYWNLDLIRMKNLYRVATPQCLKQTFGKTYSPLLAAVRRGERGTEPPEEYAAVVKQRCTDGRVCGNGGMIPALSE